METFTKHVVVTRKNTGLGSDLISIVGAIEYAKKTDREVVIDWRSSQYLKKRNVNLFPLLFQIPQEIDGVRVHSWDETFSDKKLPQPLAPCKKWSFEDYHLEMTKGPEPKNASAIIERPMHHLPDVTAQKRILSCFNPQPAIMEMIGSFDRQEFQGHRVIGVHLRHGNGERLGQKRDDLTANPVERLVDMTVERILNVWESNMKVFVCTDSQEFRDSFSKTWSDTCHFDSKIGTAGRGPIHLSCGAIKNAEDAVAEMWLLARCQGIVYNPSWFSHYARIAGEFAVEPQNIDDLSDYGTLALYEKKYANLEAKAAARKPNFFDRCRFWKKK